MAKDKMPKLPPVKKEDIEKVDKEVVAKLDKKWREGLSQHQQRTKGFEIFAKIAHNLSIYGPGNVEKKTYSEGSTQAIKRKIRSQTIQRVPDGEIVTQYDKNSLEQVEIEYIFKHKVLQSEFDGKDMLKQLWKTFNVAYDYGFACVRTGFEEDLDGDPRISYTLIPYNDVIPSPDCKSIEEADWYIVREYIPISTLKTMIDWETGAVNDPTYVADVVRYLVENDFADGAEPQSVPLADRKKGASPNHSVEVRTYYCKGSDEFVTYVKDLNCVLRRVPNCDPRKDVPLHFLILEPDAEFPYGCSSVLWTLAQQQYADAFQSVAYKTLLLSMNPPLQVFGNLTNPKIKMKPNAIWPMGTNPNNRIEPYRVETTTLTQYGSILESISGRMMQSLNITDATVASDANVARYSATPQGVQEQHLDKTITINQFQKRIEVFFAEWANHALRSYLNSMSGTKELTVDEHTRRRILDIEKTIHDKAMSTVNSMTGGMVSEVVGDVLDNELPSIVAGNLISVNFDDINGDLLQFEVRSGSLIENERETERRNIQEMLVPVSQMIGNVSEQNRSSFEQVIMELIMRLCELSDIDISASISGVFDNQLALQALQATMGMVQQQQQQLDGMQGMLQQALPQQQPLPGEMPMEQPMEPMPGAETPMPEEMPPEGMPPDMMPPIEEEPVEGEVVPQ